MKLEHNLRLKNAIIGVVDQQLAANDPPETRLTLDRLVAEGFSLQEGKELIGNVVVNEFFTVVKAGKTFDLRRYVAALDLLPQLPFSSEE